MMMIRDSGLLFWATLYIKSLLVKVPTCSLLHRKTAYRPKMQPCNH